MSAQQADGWTRRRFIGGLTLAGTAGLLSLHPRMIAAEPPPETTTIRWLRSPAIEAGMIKSTPQKIIAQGTDWHFLNELKKELKG